MIPIPDEHPPSSRRKGIQLCYPFEEKRLQKWGVPFVITQPKLDGERCRAILTHGEVQLLSSEANEILSVPHIIEALSHISGEWELDGELYIHDASFEDIHSIVGRSRNIHSDFETVEYHIFDVVSNKDQASRLGDLLDLFVEYNLTKQPFLRLVETSVTENNPDKILERMNSYTKLGFEGIIVRHPTAFYVRKRSTEVMKFKPKRSDVYLVVGFKEEIDKDGIPKGTLGALECSDLEDQHFFVGSGFSADQRQMLWKIRDLLPGSYVRINYQSLTSNHVPRFPIFVEILTK